MDRNPHAPLNIRHTRLKGSCWRFKPGLGIRGKEDSWSIHFVPFLTAYIHDYFPMISCLSKPSRKKVWQQSELACCRKWAREDQSKEMGRRDWDNEQCSFSAELKKGETEDVWTTRWGTRRCGKRWHHMLHERSVDVWSTEGMKSLNNEKKPWYWKLVMI